MAATRPPNVGEVIYDGVGIYEGRWPGAWEFMGGSGRYRYRLSQPDPSATVNLGLNRDGSFTVYIVDPPSDPAYLGKVHGSPDWKGTWVTTHTGLVLRLGADPTPHRLAEVQLGSQRYLVPGNVREWCASPGDPGRVGLRMVSQPPGIRPAPAVCPAI
jgi:hypothetical protein